MQCCTHFHQGSTAKGTMHRYPFASGPLPLGGPGGAPRPIEMHAHEPTRGLETSDADSNTDDYGDSDACFKDKTFFSLFQKKLLFT